MNKRLLVGAGTAVLLGGAVVGAAIGSVDPENELLAMARRVTPVGTLLLLLFSVTRRKRTDSS